MQTVKITSLEQSEKESENISCSVMSNSAWKTHQVPCSMEFSRQEQWSG